MKTLHLYYQYSKGHNNDNLTFSFCTNWTYLSYFLYQKLNGGKNGHFCDSIVVDIDCGSFIYVSGIDSCSWFEMTRAWHKQHCIFCTSCLDMHETVNTKLSFETYKTTCVSSEETNQTYNLLNFWFDWCFSTWSLLNNNHMCRSNHDSIVIFAFLKQDLRESQNLK